MPIQATALTSSGSDRGSSSPRSAYSSWVDACIKKDRKGKPDVKTVKGVKHNSCGVRGCRWQSTSELLETWGQPKDAIGTFMDHLKQSHGITDTTPLDELPTTRQARSVVVTNGGGGVGCCSRALRVVAIVVAVVAVVGLGASTQLHHNTEVNAEQRAAWHGCSCIGDARSTATSGQSLFLPLLSSRSRHGTARFIPVHLETPFSSNDVAGWLTSAHHHHGGSCAHVASITEGTTIETVDAWTSFLRRTVDAGGHTCHVVVVGYSQVSAHVINSWKELTESNECL